MSVQLHTRREERRIAIAAKRTASTPERIRISLELFFLTQGAGPSDGAISPHYRKVDLPDISTLLFNVTLFKWLISVRMDMESGYKTHIIWSNLYRYRNLSYGGCASVHGVRPPYVKVIRHSLPI